MHCLVLLSSPRWVCAFSGSARGHISELMLSKGARIERPHLTLSRLRDCDYCAVVGE
jgi:hypothetical protein